MSLPVAPRGESTRASIIIVGYNSQEDLPRCLASLKETVTAADEVIVVDNASQDGTSQALEAHFPWVRVVRSPENLGFGGGNNLGAREAQGRYLAFLNPDTTVAPGWLDALLAALEADPTAGLATAKILLLQDPERINACGNDIHISGLTLCRGAGAPSTAFTHTETVGAVSGAAFAIRRTLFDTLGGFDPAFFMYMEDTDLSLRARLAGYRCLFVPEAVVYHRYQLRFGPRKTFYQERNRYLMLLKNLRWRTLLALLPALLLAEVVTWGFVLLLERKNMGNKVRAYGWVARHWAEIIYERQWVQSLRCETDHVLLNEWIHRLDFEQADDGPVGRLAYRVFTPLFRAAQQLASQREYKGFTRIGEQII